MNLLNTVAKAKNLFTEKNYLYILFGSIYFAQGAALAYFQNYNKSFLDASDIDETTTQIISSALLVPFVLKIFISILSDRYSILKMGKRKPYILMGLILGFSSFYIVTIFPPDKDILYFSVSIILAALSIAIIDSITDGLAIDSTDENDHGKTQGIMVGSRWLSFMILSFIFGNISDKSNYELIFWIISAFLLIPLFLFFWYKPKPLVKSEKFLWSSFNFFKNPPFLIFIIYAIIYSIISFGIDSLLNIFINKEFHPTEKEISHFNALRGIGSVTGAFIGWLFIDKIGHRNSSIFALVFLSFSALLLSFSWGLDSLLIISFIWGIAWGFQETIFFTLGMDIADIRISASMFAITMAISNIGIAIAEIIAGFFIENFSIREILQLSAVGNILPCLALLLFFYLRKKSTIPKTNI